MFKFFSPSGSHTILVYRSYTDTKHRAASLRQHSFLFSFLTIVELVIVGDLLVFLIQSTPSFYKTWRNYWHWQGNESTKFWERSGRPDPNPGSLLVEILALAEIALCEHNLVFVSV